MHTVARELPLAAVLSKQFQDTHCATCFHSLGEQVLTCDDCVDVSYCSLKCQRNDWRKVHQYECEILRSQKSSLTPTMRLSLRVLIQKFGGKSTTTPSFNGAVLNDLETNYNEFRISPTHNQFLTDMMTIINTSGCSIFPESLNTNQTIGVICSILCNSFGIIDEHLVEPIGTGIYVGMAKHNHSCSASSHVVFEKNEAILRSPNNSYCKEVTISYVSRMLPTFLRRKAIRRVHFITCNCEMCLDEKSDSIALASRCQDKQCKGFANGAKCNLCGKIEKFSYEEALDATEKLIDLLENLHKEPRDSSEEFRHLLRLRSEFSEVLADCNVAMLQLDEQIAYCAASLDVVPNDMELIATRGCEEFISRLYLGAPEVSRRLYIGVRALKRVKGLEKMKMVEFLKAAVDSCEMSHGVEHSITKFVRDALIFN